MGSALLDTNLESTPAASAGTSSAEALRLQVAERLAAHRSRRGAAQARAEVAPAAAQRADSRAARIAAAVAERYANSQSYRAFLAAEAERAVEQARAAAEVAALNAMAVAAAQQKLLDGFDEDALTDDAANLEAAENQLHGIEPQTHATLSQPCAEELSLWPDLEPQRRVVPRRSGSYRSSSSPPAVEKPQRDQEAFAPGSSNPAPGAGLTVRLHDDATNGDTTGFGIGIGMGNTGVARANRQPEQFDAEARALDEEIAFRQAPVFEEPAGPPMSLPANLIEFPRQLVASRKARPRYAEGPLRDDPLAAPEDGQLRIFEVDPAQISTLPAADAASDWAAETTTTPQWTSICLDAPAPQQRTASDADALGAPAPISQADPRHLARALPQVASLGRRMLAAVINGCVLAAGLLAFAAAFAATTGHGQDLRSGSTILNLLRQFAGRAPEQTALQPTLMLAAAAVAAGFLYLLYQGLFFSLNQATPGMRCARIALCTFEDENPTRKAMRRRILAVLLSACPFGLGFLWAALDEDRLAWHDRVSRMYQRSY